jgi:Na+/H+ antiporter NhaD/arsenite permease-like protein
METSSNDVVQISSVKFLAGCAVAATLALFVGFIKPLPSSFMAAEVLVTILALFIFGSIKYRIDKNALTFGAGLVIVATFWPLWKATWTAGVGTGNASWTDHVFHTARHSLLTLHGLDQLVHADTMLFILGLTFFVAVIAQTRLLETVSFMVLDQTGGRLVPTVAALTAIVAAASGVLDGVSMIGLMIRTLVILLFLAKAQDEHVVYAVMVSTVVTTVCGMWLAYGEPPNLIMKSNLHPHLNNAFFLRYCLPAALGSYLIVFWNMKKRLAGRTVNLRQLDILDRHTADVRFLQASRHGEVMTAVEFAEAHADTLGSKFAPVMKRIHQGVPLGEAMVNEHVPAEKRVPLLALYLDESLAQDLDNYYAHTFGRNDHKAEESSRRLGDTLDATRRQRRNAQAVGVFSFLPFVGLLILHAINHDVPLFVASFAGFGVAFLSIARLSKTRALALKEGVHEFKEYLFLLPLFLSITLLQKTGFFEHVAHFIQSGVETYGKAPMALGQFAFATVLSALLDNNVVADFLGRALKNLDVLLIHLFAMAQIAGYALGGCWTHIGSAQSVVAYSFIHKEIDNRFTPFQWIKAMTPVILEIAIFMTFLIFAESKLSAWLH